jgi:hypothetical protein
MHNFKSIIFVNKTILECDNIFSYLGFSLYYVREKELVVRTSQTTSSDNCWFQDHI